ncbi:DUF6276 family protein [Halomarina ordinaria]|uniref:DUF6276 family protein n=1 Tax=Halomarina ordinaria TaxID=3033939 RepID=A0ABD5UAG8_9EURY|nr:DUF6276 family protein [Halomarina sp. PSRA2]
MTCPECAAPLVAFTVPDDVAAHVPEESASLALCSRCLALVASPPPTGAPEFDRVSEAFPEGDAGAAMAVGVGLLDSLALHRTDIEALFSFVEANGYDPLLVVDRLARQGSIQTPIDLDRRRHQLEQLME